MNFTERLAELEPATTTEEALAFFDQLPAVRSEDILGPWAGRELATGHPMDGLLVASGWYGKRFDGLESVHPLVFQSSPGKFWFAEPRKMPMRAAGHVSAGLVSVGSQTLSPVLEHVLGTRKHRARLRNVEHRGVVSAAMVYDNLPIIDVFRWVDDRTLLGVMDQRAMKQPYFFILERDGD
jgi:hypothetical protein